MNEPVLSPSDRFTPQFHSDDMVAERFRILELLRMGATGEVYRASDLKSGQEVALKILRNRLVRHGHTAARFLREAKLARRVNHPNVCRTFDVVSHAEGAGQGGVARRIAVISMELLVGENLEEYMEHHGPLAPTRVLEIISQVAVGLDAAHRAGVIHRDLKAANVMLVDDRAVITDFGLASPCPEAGIMDISVITRPGTLVGTPAYMAPEQLKGEKVTRAADVHALGLLAFEMLTGELPFHGGRGYASVMRRLAGDLRPLSELRPDVDPTWGPAIERCLALEPSQRYSSACDFASALRGEKRLMERLWPYARLPELGTPVNA